MNHTLPALAVLLPIPTLAIGPTAPVGLAASRALFVAWTYSLLWAGGVL